MRICVLDKLPLNWRTEPTMTSPADLLDLDSIPGYFEDPHSIFSRLREETPVRHVSINGLRGWLVTRHADVRAVFNDRRLSNNPLNAHPNGPMHAWEAPTQTSPLISRNMLLLDPPDHTRLRGLVRDEFSPAAVALMHSRLHRTVDDLLDRILPAGQADLVSDFAFPLSMTVTADLLGIPEGDRDELHRLMLVIAYPQAYPAHLLSECYQAVTRLLRRIIDERPVGGTDLIDRLLAVNPGDELVSWTEVASMIFLFILAGYHTFPNMIGNSVVTLFRHPKELNRLRAHPELIGQTVNELLRYDPPLYIGVPRFAMTSDVKIGDVVIPRGDPVLPCISAANRDPACFPDPDRFWPDRPATGNLAFGSGIHHCLGATVGRAETEAALGSLLSACEDLTIAVNPDELEWRVLPHVRGPLHLPISFRPSRYQRRPHAVAPPKFDPPLAGAGF
jgi:cytochrome P450